MMKRTLSLLLALIMVLSLLPDTMAFASGGTDDIYIDDSWNPEEFEDFGIVDDYEEYDPALNGSETAEDPELDNPDVFVDDPEEPLPEYLDDLDGNRNDSDGNPEEPDETQGTVAGSKVDTETTPDYDAMMDETDDVVSGPADVVVIPEDNPEQSLNDTDWFAPQLDPFPQKTESSDGQTGSQTGEWFAGLSGMVSADMVQSNNTVLSQSLVWTANSDGTNVDRDGVAIDQLATMPSFKDGGTYEIKILPDVASASATGATQLHISLYQMFIGADTTVRIYLDESFKSYPNITEVVLHTVDLNNGSNVTLIKVFGGSLTMEGLAQQGNYPGCRLVLDGRSINGDVSYTNANDIPLLHLGSGKGAGTVNVSNVAFRNAPRSAVLVNGGLFQSINFTNCKFESSCMNSTHPEDQSATKHVRDGGAIRIASFTGSVKEDNFNATPTLVEEFAVNNCEFDSNTARRYGGAIGMYGVFDQVSIRNSSFTNNSVSDRCGGAIGIVGMANKVDIIGNTFTNCSAPGTNETGYCGGGAIGIRATVSKLTIDSDFRNCSAGLVGGALYITSTELTRSVLPHLPAGLTVRSRINIMEISGCNFTDCTSGDRGGAIGLSAQIGDVIIGTASASNTFTRCTTTGGHSGGGICFSSLTVDRKVSWTDAQWAPAEMTIETYEGTPYDDYLIRGNSWYISYRSAMVTNCTFDGCVSSYGGGLYVPNNAQIKNLVVRNVTMKNGKAVSHSSSATTGRGAALALASFATNSSIILDNLQVFNNRSDRDGGGVFIDCMDNTSITIIGGQYYNNISSKDGGGIYIDGNDSDNVNISVTGTRIYNNTSAGHGGGLYQYNSVGNSTFTDVEVYGNIAGARKDDNGNIIEKGTETCLGDGGGFYLIGKDTANVNFIRGIIGAKQVTTTNDRGEKEVTLEAAPNIAFAYTIKQIVEVKPETPDEGEGEAPEDPEEVDPENPDANVPEQPEDNTGESGGESTGEGSTETTPTVEVQFKIGGGGRGGGLSVTGALINVDSRYNAPKLEMTGTQVLYNQAECYGGGIYIHGSEATMNQLTVSDNKCGRLENDEVIYDFWERAGLYGGGIMANNHSVLTIDGGILTRNKTRHGGALALGTGSAVTMQNVTVTGNEADDWGGGAYISSGNGSASCTMNVIGCTFSQNVAGQGEGGGNGGGIMANYGSTLNMTDTKVYNNESLVGYIFKYNTEGIKEYTIAKDVQENPNFHANGKDKDGNPVYKEKNGYGGGVYISGATAMIYGSDFYDNISGRRGGGIYGDNVSTIEIYNLSVEEGKNYLNDITTEDGRKFIRSKIRDNITRDYAGGVGSVGNVDNGIVSHLILDGTLVDHNTVSRYGGGGVYISSLCVCTITEGTLVQNNTAGMYAGGIYANIRATVNVQGAEVINNTSNGTAGGIMINSKSDMVITGGRISGNKALGITRVGYGGGVYATGSAAHGGSTVTILGGEISNNIAADNGGGVYAGGASNTDQDQCTKLSIKAGTISGNRAQGTGLKVKEEDSGFGGGVLAGNASSVTIERTVNENGQTLRGSITGNYAAKYGGGVACNIRSVVNVDGGDILDNTAGSGGAIWIGSYAKAYVKDGMIRNNKAEAAWNADNTKLSYGNGGGIFATGNSQIIVTGGLITENQAYSKAYYHPKNNTAIKSPTKTETCTEKNYQGGHGGAIYAQSKSQVNVQLAEGGTTGGQITSNHATRSGGAIYADGYYSSSKDYGHATVTVQGGEISGNTAGTHGGGIYATGVNTKGADTCGEVTVTGGTISGNTAAENGGGIGANVASNVTVTGGTITGNEANVGGGVCTMSAASITLNGGSVTANNAKDSGGGVAAYNRSTVLISNGDIKQNTCSKSGGGIYASGYYSNTDNYGRSTVMVQGGTISGNTAGVNGGGIYATGVNDKGVDTCAYVTISGGIISSNTAAESGGGIGALKSSTVLIKGGEIKENTCTLNGAGIYANGDATVTMQQSDDTETFGSITYNSGATQGGGIYAGGSSKVTLKKGYIQYNTAKFGGGLYASGEQSTGTTVQVQGGEISHNTALLGNGGGIYAISSANVTISDGKVNENSALSTDEHNNTIEATGRGGGIYVASYKSGSTFYGAGAVTVTGGEIRKNTAEDSGGGIYATSYDDSNENLASSITVSGGKIYENHAQYGGGIYATWCADVRVENGEIYLNQAVSGAGIYTSTNADVWVTGGEIYQNIAQKTTELNGQGGGLFATGNSSVIINGGTIRNNTATGTGGGIFMYNGSNVTIKSGYIQNNFSHKTGGGIAVYQNVGGDQPVLEIQGGIISGNATRGKNDAGQDLKGQGGGIRSYAEDNTVGGRITITNGTISGNTATNGQGGGVCVSNGTVLTISGGTISDNTATKVETETGYGGAVFMGGNSVTSISGGTISENSASNGGGCLATGHAQCTITGGTITLNQASGGGGGVYATGNSILTVSGGTISKNEAVIHGGGILSAGNSTVYVQGGFVQENQAVKRGGGMLATTSTNLTVSGGTISKNTAENGAGIYANDDAIVKVQGGSVQENEASSCGGGIYATHRAHVSMEPKPGDATAIGSIINNHATVMGGGIFATESAMVSLSQGNIQSNSAQHGGGIYAEGGATTHSTVTVNGGQIADNTAQGGNGGGIYAICGAVVTVSGGIITRNHAVMVSGMGGYGGGIYATGYVDNGTNYGGAVVTITDGTISYNTATSNGGGIYTTGVEDSTEANKCATLHLEGGSVEYNTANNGGGIGANMVATVTVESGKIDHNTAANNGGGIYANGSATVIMRPMADSNEASGGVVSNNQAICGGGMYITGAARVTVSAGQIVYNTSTANGGGVYMITAKGVKSYLTINGGQISHNIAKVSGGAGIYATGYSEPDYSNQDGSVIKITNGEISYNVSEDGNGGGITLAQKTQLNISGGTISHNSTTQYQKDETTKEPILDENGQKIMVDSYGGGIIQTMTSSATITGGTITENTADYGGGIYVAGNVGVICKLYGGSVVKNTARKCGGGLTATGSGRIEVWGGKITENIATDRGGGICSLLNSQVLVNGGETCNNEANHGGGIAALDKSEITVEGGKVYNNIATKTTTSQGGGLYAQDTAKIFVNGGEIYANQSKLGGGVGAISKAQITVEGGKVYKNSAPTRGGGVHAEDDAKIFVNGGEIYENESQYGAGAGAADAAQIRINGGKVYKNTAAQRGGGLHATNDAKIFVLNGEIFDNATTGSGDGGGINGQMRSQITVQGGKIFNNLSADRGGGINGAGSAQINIQGGEIYNNTAATRGGGISAEASIKITVDGGEIYNNTAKANGGGVALTDNATITVQGGQIMDNTANTDGGGLYIVAEAIATIEGGEISGNKAAKCGGGIYVGSTVGKATVTIKKAVNDNGEATVGVVKENMADNGGGVYVSLGGKLFVNEGHIINNEAVAPKNADLPTTGKIGASALHGVGGGICMAGSNQYPMAYFTLTGDTTNSETINVGIYGNKATFSGDEVFSNGINTSLSIPLVRDMNLDGYDLDIVAWFEDYNTGDSRYSSGLNMMQKHGVTGGSVKRYRNSSANERQVIEEQYVNGEGLPEGVRYVNMNDTYVAMALGIPNAANDTIVVDYGLSVDIDLLSNDMLLKSSEPETQCNLGKTLPGDVAADKDILYSPMYDKNAQIIDTGFRRYLTTDEESTIRLNFGTANWKKVGADEIGVLRYTMKDIKMDSEEVFYYVVPGEKFYYYATVTVVPATTLYYEDNISQVTYHTESAYEELATWTPIGSATNPDQDKDRPGASILDGLDADNIYGYDSSYTSTATYSNGGAHWVTATRHRIVDVNADNICDFCKETVGHDWADTDKNQKCDVCGNTGNHHCKDTNLDHKCDTCQAEMNHTHDVFKDSDKDGICDGCHGTKAHSCIDTRDKNGYCDLCGIMIGTHTKAARATFTFTGTGFDIISLCNRSTGIVMVSVYEGEVVDFDNPPFTEDRYVASYVVDTHAGYVYNEETGKWEYDENSKTVFYQVPVIKADLTKVVTVMDDPNTKDTDESQYKDWGYGTYSVEIYVAPSFLEREASYWSSDFYLDAIRIYNPAGYNGVYDYQYHAVKRDENGAPVYQNGQPVYELVTKKNTTNAIQNAYQDDAEGWPVYTELRNMFIQQKELNAEGTSGVVFIDGKGNTAQVSDYKSWGPNNEVYLNPGEHIAFSLDAAIAARNVEAIHIGMRGLTGKGEVTIRVGESVEDATLLLNTELSTTDLYFNISAKDAEGNFAIADKVIVISNSGEAGSAPISITNVKVTHSAVPEYPVKMLFKSSARTAQIALEILAVEDLVEPVVTPKRPALSFNGMVSYNVFFSAENLGDLTAADLGLAVFSTEDPEGTVETAREVVMGATEIDGLYMIATGGVHAKYLGDKQYFRTFAKKADGTIVYSRMVSYSALDYAKNVLAKSSDVSLKRLVVAMLNYGAEAQKFFGYKTDDLMNKDLTADDQALLAGFDATALKSVGKVDASKVGKFASTGGFTKRSPAISFKGAFEINYFFTPANAVDGEMTLYFWNENTYNTVTELTAENADKAVTMTLENGSYTASSDEIAAKYLDRTVYAAAVYESDGVTYCSGVLPYSIATYCQKPPATVQELATAAAIYGCTAKQYFGA